MNINTYLAEHCQRINSSLTKYLPESNTTPQKLHAAMRYSVLNGGKRIRPLLLYASGETLGAKPELLDAPAAAIELIHCYSLIHDDLPAMDNDDWRRGKPSCHKAFDEATAILAGDTLYNLAFTILTRSPLSAEKCREMLTILTEASGSSGMAGGQALDLTTPSDHLTIELLEQIHHLKTGALIRASIKLGALAADNITETQLDHLEKFATALGLAFQIQDDILDADEISEHKINYVSFLGLETAKDKLRQLKQQINEQLGYLDCKTDSPLQILTQYTLCD
ncbi:MAG: polyprenyl synthetase family protein [Gammaproteobacteria bacterium]|nr:polyprenyl synthetase family protein [Gammaproteobacteria bacterium]